MRQRDKRERKDPSPSLIGILISIGKSRPNWGRDFVAETVKLHHRYDHHLHVQKSIPIPMQIICFEDDRVDQLRPITQARPTYAITCASFRLIDWLRRLPGQVTGCVRPYLRELQRLDYEVDAYNGDTSGDDGILLINARLVPTMALATNLQQLARETRSCIVTDPVDQAVLAARITAKDLASHPQETVSESAETLVEFSRTLPSQALPLDVFRWPHDVISHHMREMPGAMNWRLEHGNYRETADGVFVLGDARIGDYAAVDTSEGPILLDEHVRVGPFCYLSGPVYAGPGTRVIEHAALKDGVSLGHTVKIGGEVEASVIEPYTNKQHHGFLGHSYLGSWINLGAGTCNSDLKNTYGKINIQYGTEKVASDMQFLGCFIGDYSKTAINTSIFTGKVIGVCSMMYGFVTSNVPSYVNYARLFGQTSLLPADVMINTQQRMFARRNFQQRECDKQLIRDMYDLSADERASVDQEIL